MRRPCERLARRSGKNLSAAPVAAAAAAGTPNHIFFAENPTYVMCLVLLQRPPLQRSRAKTSDPWTSQTTHPLLLMPHHCYWAAQSPTTATTLVAAAPLAAVKECDSKTSSQQLTAITPLFITPLPAWSVAAKLLSQQQLPVITPTLSPPEYTPPPIRYINIKITPTSSPWYAVYHTIRVEHTGW